MPTYDYICTACGHEFELVQKITDPPRKRCPRCGRKVQRRIGAGAGLIFKGSGFHITDYRSPEYQAKAKAEKGDGGGKSSESGESGSKGSEAGGSGAEKGSGSSEGSRASSSDSRGREGRRAPGGKDSTDGVSGTKKAGR